MAQGLHFAYVMKQRKKGIADPLVDITPSSLNGFWNYVFGIIDLV